VSHHDLRLLVRRGVVEHVQRGLYRLTNTEPTEDHTLAVVAARVPRAVVCLLSALRVHGIGTQTPAEVWLAIHHKARPPRLLEVRHRIVRFSGPAWSAGIIATRFEGVPSQITSPARTIVDCFRYERLVGPEIPMEALKDALRRRMVTPAAIARILEVLPSRRLDAALDVLT
jgi:predicted transcriptional regulator of viral defense system